MRARMTCVQAAQTLAGASANRSIGRFTARRPTAWPARRGEGGLVNGRVEAARVSDVLPVLGQLDAMTELPVTANLLGHQA
jgi:hypothetical protein